ncbi:hypothetical protein M408DRAFT_21890 [Serendipita vermifera MAFF 305830]|uniref:Uncharacterized protein n=1 Tax=Serendipita vermifera MAFF 305830 TaxID=933852 RepID=A0A0C2XN05_SERVB|nr:hypothetical protein M408DRAFT_21890 [Serendipita vermifera MAFF 305830]
MILSYEHEDVTITLDEMEVISNRLLRDPKATEIVSQYLDDIKTSNPALHMMLDEETRQLAAMPGSRHFYALHGCGGAVEEEITNEHPLDEMTNVASGVYINGVLKHPCANCGTLYDRKARANDCRNADLGIKPYKCLGKCGFDSWHPTAMCEDINLALRDMEVTSDCLLRDPKATEQVSKYLYDIKISNPALHEMLEEDARQVAAMPGCQHFYALHGHSGVVEHPLNSMTTVTSGVYINGVLKHPCPECEILYDRKARANDCRNADLGIKPYKCLGKCGFDPWYVVLGLQFLGGAYCISYGDSDKEYASKQFLTRHCGEKVKKCGYCQKYRSTQNISRHLKTCVMRP